MSRRRSFDVLTPGRWLLVLAIGMVELAAPQSARASQADATQSQQQVLVLYSTRRDAQIVSVVEREVPRILAEGLGQPVDYYSEFIDQARFPDPVYEAAFRDFLRLKYAGHHFDLVIAIQDVAADFLARHRKELFRNTPIVLFANSGAIRQVENSTGIIGDLHLDDTLALALSLQPRTRHVFVVSGAGARDRTYETVARAQLRPFESSLTITYLSALTTKALHARLARLPADSIVYFLLVYRDGAGENFQPLEYLDRVTAVANAPVYSWVDSAMGRGVVGGRLRNQQAQAHAVARLALRILRGERADSIPISSPVLDVTEVDWRQLRRWDISEARIPRGTVVRFREPGPWEIYRVYILGAAAVLIAQTMLIAGLLVQRTRRRRAEEQMRGSEAQLRTTHGRIRDLGSRLLNAQEGERSRIGRELHDDIGQQLALLTIDLELLANGNGHRPATLAAEALDRAHELASSVHDLSLRVHPAKLRLLGLVPALQALQREVSHSEVSVQFTHDDIPTNLPPDMTLCLFRVAQEALQNAVKYSQADEISMHLARGMYSLTLTIADDGVGFDVHAAWGKGLGLISMRERLDAVDGTLEIHSEHGAGTRLEVSAPLPAPEGREAEAV